MTADNASGADVVVEDLKKTFHLGGSDLEVLRGVNFSLERGEMAAVVGASGAGKSTLLHVLGTLDLPSSGTLQVNGTDVTSLAPSKLSIFRNRTIGFVFQFHHLLPEFTALENTMMPCLIQRMPRPVARDKAMEILTRVGLAKRTTHRPGELSGGEQQRVAIARALVMEPALVLADEPTGNLDAHTSRDIHELFIDVNREKRCTVLVVTHNLELANRMPRRLEMKDGTIGSGDAE